MTTPPPKIRRCTECKQVFATPASFHHHKGPTGACKNPDLLVEFGFKQTKNGWLSTKARKTFR